MKKSYVLGLDLGTTGNRAIVFDKKQKIVFKTYEEFPQIYPRPGWVEHDPEAIWQSAKKILFRTFEKIPARQMAAVGVTNQRETIVLWDKKTGRPIYNAIVWQCRRTTPLCESLKQKGLGLRGIIVSTSKVKLDIRGQPSKVVGMKPRLFII